MEKTYTIELADNLGRGTLVLRDGHIQCILPSGEVEDTGVSATPDNYDDCVYQMYGGSSVWDLRYPYAAGSLLARRGGGEGK